MVGEMKRLRVGLADHLALVEGNLPQHDAVVFLAQTGKEFAERLVRGLPIGGGKFRFRKGHDRVVKLFRPHRVSSPHGLVVQP